MAKWSQNFCLANVKHSYYAILVREDRALFHAPINVNPVGGGGGSAGKGWGFDKV